MLRVTGDAPQMYQSLIANLLTCKAAANGLVEGPLFMSEKFTACRVEERDHTGFNLLEGVTQCLLVDIERGISRCETQVEEPDDSSGNNTVATAIAPRHGDALTHRAVTPSVESHPPHC